ncbi:MAG TPA: zinc-binding dehydrogenase [Gemmatimonadales bacterium]|nr:zinc-binding dehydrogenase [Gemmatimonadales bacterium]
MKAAIFHGAHQPLRIEDVPTPQPGPGEILIRVAGCGVCHTDLHYIDHGTPTFKQPPVILGHEIAGTVAAVGSGLTQWSEGDRALVPAVLTCGRCGFCRQGRENLCAAGTMLGNHIDGGFAEFVVVPAKDVVRLPEDVPLVEGSIIADAVTTPFHAVVRRGRVAAGDWVVVFGCGGVGLSLVQVAAAVGARVIAVDVKPAKLAIATRFGAAAALDAGMPKLDREVRRITEGGADVAFEAVGRAAAQNAAFDSLRAGGRLVLVGYSPETMPLNAGRTMFREIEVVGSLGCRPVDYPRAVELVRQGRIRLMEMVTHRFPLDQIGEAFEVLRCGDAIRVVVTP